MRCAGAFLAPAALYRRRAGARLIFAGASDLDFDAVRVRNLTRRDEWLFRWGFRRADDCLVQNQAQADLVRRNHGRDSMLVPNFLHDPTAGRADPHGPVIWVGNITPVKRPLLLLQLARRLPQRRFVMVGGAGTSPAAQQLLAQVQTEAARIPNLELIGHVPPDKVGRHFDGAAVLVNTSEIEGFPNTFLQSWVRGVPTLAFVDPQVSPGVGGNLACADLDDMTVRMQALLGDRTRWTQASEHCRGHFAAHHSRDAARSTYARLFNRPISP
jgi:glycosyltransferase involved in cell wall biosynthesis